MAEDDPPAEAGQGEAPPAADAPAPAPEPSPAADTVRRATRRRSIVIGIASAAVVVVVLVLLSGGSSYPIGTLGIGSGLRVPLPLGGMRRLSPARGSGDQRLAGLVIDGGGAPVHGAQVIAELEEAAAPVGRSAAVDGGVPAPVVAVSSPSGTFVLEGLVAGRHRLRVEGDELFTAEVRFVPVPSDDLRIVVARQIRVDGIVVDGGPVAGATVELASDVAMGRLSTVTGADGRFSFTTLPEGTYQVWATRGHLAARALRVPRLGAGPFSPVELRLENAAIVVGRAVERGTDRGLVAEIELRPAPDAGAEDEPPRFARSDSSGVFRIEGVPDGRWIADAWAPGWIASGGVEFDAGRATPEVELVRGGAIEGIVIDGAGQPIAGARIAAWATGPDGQGLEASADAEARAAGRHAGLGSAAPPARDTAASLAGDSQFVARGELGVLLGPIPYPPPGGGATRHARILDEPVAVRLGSPAAPPPPLPVDPAFAGIWTTGSDGRFRVAGLAKAAWTVVAYAPGFADGRSRAIKAGPGDRVTGVEIVASAGVVVVGTVRDGTGPVSGAVLEIRGRGKGPAQARGDTVTAPDGSYRLGPFTGEVTLRVNAYGHGEILRELDLSPPGRPGGPEERREDILLVAADAELEGVVEDPTGLPARGARVVITGGPASGRSTVAGDAGRFRLQYLPPGTHPVRVEHVDFPPIESDAATGTPARLRLAFGGGLEGLVFDHHTGAPIAGVAVTAAGPRSARREVATGTAGQLRLVPLVPGTWTLRIAVPGYLPLTRAVEVSAGDRAGAVTARDLRLELERGANLGGTVRDRFGSRVPGARVVVRRKGETEISGEARTDADGEFRLRDVPTGDLAVEVDKDALRGVREVNLRVGDELLSLDVEIR